jgi:hypothetical protein
VVVVVSPQLTLTATPVPIMGKVTDPGVLLNVKDSVPDMYIINLYKNIRLY